MQKLIQGIRQFQGNCVLPLQQLFEQLVNGQNPETLFITCSDPRIDLGVVNAGKRLKPLLKALFVPPDLEIGETD